MRNLKKVLALLLAVMALTFSLSAGALAAGSDPVTRAEVVQRLYELEGEPPVIQSVVFDDAAGTPYSNAATWAYGADISRGGGDGQFYGQRPITRAELFTMLHRYAKYKNMDVSVGEDTNILSYNDAFYLPEWCISAFQWACGESLVSDVDGYLLPDGIVTVDEFDEILVLFGKLGKTVKALSTWSDDSETKALLISYIEDVTDENSPQYIPVEDRIAVFDFDGTLFCETDPNYFDYTLLVYRVLEDPEYKDKASDFEREVANKIKEQNETGKSFPGLEIDHGKAVASAFAGMTLKEFNDYIQEFKKQPMPSYSGMTRGEGFYLPMLQVVHYLMDNDFTIYVISGTDRLIVRGIFYDNVLDIPNRQIIGSDETIVASGQDGADGLNYMFQADDQLILGGDFIIKNLKMNKVSVIMQEIGQQPVLSFGNSTGDNSMAEYVISNNPYKSLAFMLCCDDLERENGNQAKADNMYSLCEQYGWHPISMKNDWNTIYGYGVTYLGAESALKAVA